MRFILIIFLLPILTIGCNKAYFQPPPPEYKTWSKSGASELDVKKAMLECGMKAPYAGANIPQDTNEYYLAALCMESIGFVDLVWTPKERCSSYPEIPACQPDAVIPKPSVERRLNSEYCQYARSRIDPVRFEKCLKEEVRNPLYTTTTEACIYRYRDLRAECRP